MKLANKMNENTDDITKDSLQYISIKKNVCIIKIENEQEYYKIKITQHSQHDI